MYFNYINEQDTTATVFLCFSYNKTNKGSLLVPTVGPKTKKMLRKVSDVQIPLKES